MSPGAIAQLSALDQALLDHKTASRILMVIRGQLDDGELKTAYTKVEEDMDSRINELIERIEQIEKETTE